MLTVGGTDNGVEVIEQEGLSLQVKTCPHMGASFPFQGSLIFIWPLRALPVSTLEHPSQIHHHVLQTISPTPKDHLLPSLLPPSPPGSP